MLGLCGAAMLARPVEAHPAPFSYLDARFGDGVLRGRLVLHDLDLAHDLKLASPDSLSTEAGVQAQAHDSHDN